MAKWPGGMCRRTVIQKTQLVCSKDDSERCREDRIAVASYLGTTTNESEPNDVGYCIVRRHEFSHPIAR